MVSKTGDTMIGNLNMDNATLVTTSISSGTGNISFNNINLNDTQVISATTLNVPGILSGTGNISFNNVNLNNGDTLNSSIVNSSTNLSFSTQDNIEMRFNNNNTISMFDNYLIDVGNIKVIEKKFSDSSIQVNPNLNKFIPIINGDPKIRLVFVFHDNGSIAQVTIFIDCSITNNNTNNSYDLFIRDSSDTNNLFGYSNAYQHTAGVTSFISCVLYNPQETTTDISPAILSKDDNGFTIEVRERTSINAIQVSPVVEESTVEPGFLGNLSGMAFLNGTLTYILRKS